MGKHSNPTITSTVAPALIATIALAAYTEIRNVRTTLVLLEEVLRSLRYPKYCNYHDCARSSYTLNPSRQGGARFRVSWNYQEISHGVTRDCLVNHGALLQRFRV